MGRQRIYFWDNMKTLLIYLVVLGHFLLNTSERNDTIRSVIYFIYIFHMPAFIFVSGYFSKSYIRKNNFPDINKLVGFFVLYIMFKLLIGGIYIAFGKNYTFRLFYEDGAPWYLFAMIFWYLCLPFFAKLTPAIGISISVVAGLFAGLEKGIDATFSLSRIIVYLPFFVWGYYYEKETDINQNRRRKVVQGVVGLIFLGIIQSVIYIKIEFMKKISPLLYANCSYSKLEGFTDFQGMLVRSGIYLIAAIIIMSIMKFISEKQLCISWLGSRTLTIYVVHRLIRDILVNIGVMNAIPYNGVELLLIVILLSFIVMIISSNRYIDILLTKISKFDYKKYMIREIYIEESKKVE